MITEGDSITHNSVVSDSGRVVSVAHEKVDGVAVVEVTSNRRRKPYGTSRWVNHTTIHDELIRLIHPTCPSHDVDRDVARSSPLRNIHKSPVERPRVHFSRT